VSEEKERERSGEASVARRTVSHERLLRVRLDGARELDVLAACAQRAETRRKSGERLHEAHKAHND
jgi:hypothetical protein